MRVTRSRWCSTGYFCCKKNRSTSMDDHEWKELIQIEKKRRDLLVYDLDPGYAFIFRRFRKTIIEYILYDKLFWATMLIFLGVRLYDTYRHPDHKFEDDPNHEFDTDKLDQDNVLPEDSGINTIGMFLSLILTFFINQARSDYAYDYTTSMTAKGKITEMATLVSSILPKEKAYRIVRYMNAAHLAGYVGLSDTYNRDNFFNHFNKEICEGGILTRKELLIVDKIDRDITARGKVCWAIIAWAMRDIQNALKDGDIDNRTASSLRSTLLDFRSSMSVLFNIVDQPSVTFFYFHLVSFLCCIYLPLFSMYQAYQANQHTTDFTLSDIIQFVVVFVQCCYVIGLRLLAIKLLDPFGDDVEDLSVMTFIRTGWESSNEVLETEYPSKTASLSPPCLLNNKSAQTKLSMDIEQEEEEEIS